MSKILIHVGAVSDQSLAKVIPGLIDQPTRLNNYAWFDDYTLAERNFHQMFSRKRVEGEWFDLNEADLAQVRAFGQRVAVAGLS